MLFSGIPFLYYFLPLVLAVYFLAPAGWKNAVLAFFSLLFYGWGEPVYLLLLVLTLTFTYGMGRLAGRAAPERLWAVTAAAVTVQLLLLVVFKYAGLLFLGGGKTVFPLPLGISFYTFQMVSYTVDLYRGSVKPARSLVDFATYAAAFPQLIAGPIVRYQEVDQQMAHRRHSADAFYAGLRRFLVGLGKKVLLANQLALLGETFRRSAEPSVLFYWLYAVSFTLQIYFDFSGYSDMAVGLGKLFGFTYPENFRYPYTSRSITEFWRRWHITLGGWFRDYVYIPLGGSRVKRGRWLFNMLAVWTLTGLWHGASWTFAVWGVLYAALMIGEKWLWGGWLKKHSVSARLYTLLFVTLGFVLFQAESFSQAGSDLMALFGMGNNPLVSTEAVYCLRSYGWLLFVSAVGCTPLPHRLWEKMTSRGGRLWAAGETLLLAGLLLLVTAYLVGGSFNPFLYFRF